MALSTRGLQTLMGRVENDNRPLALVPARPAARPLPQARALEFDYRHLATRLEVDSKILWARMQHAERACYTPELMRDMREFQLSLRDGYAGLRASEMPVRYLVWASDAPRVWSLGGDLTSFTAMIRGRDEAGLRSYAHLAIDIIYENYVSMDLPILTVGLIEGDAIGGGFEAMLTDDIVIAERGAKFGLPEILFNLFPGMGAYSFLKRRVGPVTARRLIEDGITRSADEMKELGLVDIVCDKGQAEATLRGFEEENRNRFATLHTLKRVRDRIDPVSRRELMDVVDLWVELAMQLNESDLRRMDCLARVQQKRRVGG
ncbi:MAG TPA: crotonase/enoyl-CoA hydratase family protein [Geminicoccaceae bacterium]|nr:crotonase/enoyl-CoA hydratase family protein [Geminicoccaceae bacterium]